MASVSSLGVGTGTDLGTLLTKLVAAESTPLTQLNTQQTTQKNKLSAIGQLKSSLDTLKTSVQAFSTASTFQAYQSTVADSSYATATATGLASAGSYTLRVDSLAKANKLQSTANPTVSAGTLSIELGNITTGSFVAKSGTTAINVNFTGSTLEELRTAINDASAGVTASIINGTSGKQLVLTSNETGANNTIRLSGTSGLSGLSFNPLASDTSFTVSSAAQDASIKLDGTTITSSTNTVTDAVTGVSINLLKAHSASAPTDTTTLTVSPDTSAMSTKLNAFVTAWNNLNSLSKTLTKYDATTKTAATLNGDGTPSSIASQLRSVLFSSPSGASSTYPRLADIGISLAADGSMTLDSSKLSTAMTTNLAAVTSTAAAFGSAFKTAITDMTDSDGLITNRQSALNRIISGMDTRRTELQRRIDAIQAKYQKQFTALDVTMGQLTTQSTYLTQQLARLS